MPDPVDRIELAACPACGRTNTLLANGIVTVVVPARAGSGMAPMFGRPRFAALTEGAAVTCNANACRWTGTVEEVWGAQGDAD